MYITSEIREDHLRNLQTLAEEFPELETMCICREKTARQIGRVNVYPWDEGIEALGL